jgi:hypothetical protein
MGGADEFELVVGTELEYVTGEQCRRRAIPLRNALLRDAREKREVKP